jgi:hypothetical protein
MKRTLLLLTLTLTAFFSFAQFNDTTALKGFIRDSIKDRRPEKITAAQLQKALLGTANLLSGIDSISYSQATAKASAGQLTTGAIYRINGVDSALYGGTTIFLQALSKNEFSQSGWGIFYNPKYSDTSLHLFKPLVFFTSSDEPEWDRTLDDITATADNGATGKYIAPGIIFATSGDWSGAVTFVAGGIGTITLDAVTVKTYSVDDKVLWDGKAWSNRNGNRGVFDNFVGMDTAEWNAISYTDTNYYRKVVDIIRYDISANVIYSREDNLGNKVSNSVGGIADLFGSFQKNPISCFKWGVPSTINTGCFSNTVYGLFDCVNWDVVGITRNTVSDHANIYSNYTFGFSIFDNNKFESNTDFSSNVLGSQGIFGSAIFNNNFNNTTIQFNQLIGANLYYNTFETSKFWQNYLVYDSTPGDAIPVINGNVGYGIKIMRNKLFNNARIEGNLITSNGGDDNTGSGIWDCLLAYSGSFQPDSAARISFNQIGIRLADIMVANKATSIFKQDITKCKKYVAIVNQTGSGDPTATVLENALGSPISWTFADDGQFRGILTGAFPAGKTAFLATQGNGANGVLQAFRFDNNTMFVYQYDLFGAYANGLTDVLVEIRVYE